VVSSKGNDSVTPFRERQNVRRLSIFMGYGYSVKINHLPEIKKLQIPSVCR
jgi:hypothetical protein